MVLDILPQLSFYLEINFGFFYEFDICPHHLFLKNKGKDKE